MDVPVGSHGRYCANGDLYVRKLEVTVMRHFFLAVLLALVSFATQASELQSSPPVPPVPFGTAVGTAAQGNDSRITGAVQSAGTGLSKSGTALLVDPSYLRSYLAGCTLSTDAVSTVSVAACVATSATNDTISKLAAFSKTTAGAWVAGSGSAGMGQGLTVANSTWYDVCAANNGGAPDIFFDTAVSGQTPCAQHRPSTITDTAVRRLGSVLTDGAAHILAFVQRGRIVYWSSLANKDAAAVATSASQLLQALTVPPGVRVRPIIRVSAVTTTLMVTSPDQPSTAPNAAFTTAPGFGINAGAFATIASVYTNTARQIQLVASGAGTTTIYTDGWIDDLGQYD